MASQQCEANTNSGSRCKRVARVTLRRFWDEPFLFFFHKKVEKFDHFCRPHADAAKVGEEVEE